MTEEDKRNERLKLLAGWLNTIATATWTVGAFIPAGQYVYGLLPVGLEERVVYGLGAGCMGLGIFIHFAGQWFLGYLE